MEPNDSECETFLQKNILFAGCFIVQPTSFPFMWAIVPLLPHLLRQFLCLQVRVPFEHL